MFYDYGTAHNVFDTSEGGMTKRPTFATRISAGSWAVDAHSGFRIFNSDREEIAAINGNAAEFRRMAEHLLKAAREKDAIEVFE